MIDIFIRSRSLLLLLSFTTVTDRGRGLKCNEVWFSFIMKKLQLLITVLSLLHLSAGDPRLVCPETVVTRIGDNVTLSCHLEPEENIEHETVEVTKVDPDVLVYAYYNGKQLANYYDAYKNRTFLNTDDLKNGVVNLKISSVRQSDNGTYRIHIYTPTKRLSSTVTLVVDLQRETETHNSSSAWTSVEGVPLGVALVVALVSSFCSW